MPAKAAAAPKAKAAHASYQVCFSCARVLCDWICYIELFTNLVHYRI